MNEMLKPFGSQSFFIGLGVAAIGYLLGPQIKESLRPVAVKGVQGAMVLSDQTKHMMSQGKDTINHMVEKTHMTGAQHQVPMDQTNMFQALLNELKAEREHSNKILEELKNTVTGLKDEIAQIKTDVNGTTGNTMQ
jgi:ABC-type phosphate transport system auxiliary subunit